MFEILIIILTFSLLIILHELGHFLVAKKFGVRVDEFGLGLPPRLFSKRIGETIFSFNLVPVGGFVKLYGEEKDVQDSQSFSGKPVWQRALIIIAGCVAFWIVAAFLLSFIYGPIGGIQATFDFTYTIIVVFIQVIESLVIGEALPVGVQVMGPVGIFDFMGNVLGMGIIYFIKLVAILAIHLAIFNLLPIPALDGGKLLFLGIEAIRGRPVPERIEQNITAVFFFLLIGLIIFVSIQDIIRIF